MVTDFGLAKKVEGDSGLTATGQSLGTPGYMPPEQASGKIDEVTETADIYSLSAILAPSARVWLGYSIPTWNRRMQRTRRGCETLPTNWRTLCADFTSSCRVHLDVLID